MVFFLGLFDAFVNLITGIPLLTRPLRRTFDRRVYQQAYNAIHLADKKKSKAFYTDVLVNFAGTADAFPQSGFHYALRGYVKGAITNHKGHKVVLNGRIKGLPSPVMVFMIRYAANKELKRLSTVADPASPRQGHTTAEVVAEAADLIRGKAIRGNGWTAVAEHTKWAAAVLVYYERSGQVEKAEQLRALMKAGRVRAGPMTTAYGAHVIVDGLEYILIATNDNPSLSSTLVHESNGGTHEDNLREEENFARYAFNPHVYPPVN